MAVTSFPLVLYKKMRMLIHRRFVRLLVITLVALSFYTYSGLFTSTIEHGPYSSSIKQIFKLLNQSDIKHIDDLEGFSHLSANQRINLMRKLRYAIKDIAKKCLNKIEYSETCKNRLKTKGKVLTLFTTWTYDKDKFAINNKTLFNWKKLPNVNLIVFSNESKVAYFSKLAGFHVLPVIKHASESPVLPFMFKESIAKFDSLFYGFANGDILFTNNLITTLEKIQCFMIDNYVQKNVLVVGKRVNVKSSLISDASAVSWSDLDSIADRHGEIFMSGAEDFFITDSQYPWDSFLPVVVGRRAYDNWVVAYSRYHNMTVIDTTETVLAVHQTLESRGNYEGLSKGNYNMDLIEELDLSYPYYSWGITDCCEVRTWQDLCGNFMIAKRTKLLPQCSAFYSYSDNLFRHLGFA